MKIRKITGIALIALTAGFGTDYGYRRYQEESADKYISAQIGHAAQIDSKNANMHEFVMSLDENRLGLMKKLNLTDEQYKNYRNLAIGIAKEETNFGLNYSSTCKKYFPRTAKFFKWIGSKITGSKNDKLSEGLTNFKITLLKDSDEEMKELRMLGVSDITKPSQSAVATIEHIDFLSKRFPTYLKNFPQKPAEQVTLNEYILARWNGLRPSMKHVREGIIADRTAANPSTYVGRVLKFLSKVPK